MASFTLPNTVAGGSITVQGNSLADAQANAAAQTGVSLAQQQGGGTFGDNSLGASSGINSNNGAAAAAAPVQQASSLDAISQSMLQALATGNKAAFDEAVREFDATHGLDQQKYQAQIDQFNQTQADTAAGLTGTYNGQPTLAAQQQAQNIAAQDASLTGYLVPPGSGPPAATSGNGYFIGTDGRIHVGSPTGTGQAGWGSAQGNQAAAGWAPGTQSSDPSLFLQPYTPARAAQAQSSAGIPSGAIPTLAAQAQAAGLSGTYNGAPTEAARQFNVTANQNAINQQDQTTQNYLTLLSNLKGPANAFQYARTLQGTPNGLQDIVNAAAGRYNLGGPPSGAVAQQSTIGSLFTDINNPNAAANGTNTYSQPGAASTVSNPTDPNAQGLPLASQIDSRAYNQMLPSQQALLWGAYQNGNGPTGAMDPADAQAMYKQSLPDYAGPAAGGVKLFTA